jgi:hypothetical protein
MKAIGGWAIALVLLNGACAPNVEQPSASETGYNPDTVEFGYNDETLALKQMFAEQEIAALAQPFVGVRTSDGKQSGLFPLHATGVSTEPVREAAEAFLALLTPEQLLRTQFAVDASEWRRWSNIDNGLYVRAGTSLREMSEPQRKAAMTLMRASLSAKGFELTEAIRRTEQTLSEINDDILQYGEDLYFFTVMGEPLSGKPWGWQIDGHHLVINYFVMGDQVVMTPVFLGGEPAVAQSGKYSGNAVLQDEQNAGLAFMQSLDPELQRAAALSARKTANNNLAQANSDNVVIDYSGLRASALPASQKQDLLDLIGLFVANMDDGHARVKMSEVEALLDETWFAWVGAVSDDAVFYYRIHSPVILIEFDHQVPVGTRSIHPAGVPTRDHIHIVVRTPNGNDYGKDLLAQHLQEHPH